MNLFSKPLVLSTLIFSAIVGFGFSAPEFIVNKSEVAQEMVSSAQLSETPVPSTTVVETNPTLLTTTEKSPETKQSEFIPEKPLEKTYLNGLCPDCIGHSKRGKYTPESPLTCSPVRRFLAEGFKKVSEDIKFREGESSKSPRACITHIARSFAGIGQRAPNLASCSVIKGKQKMSYLSAPACISNVYVNVVHNTLEDVFDCFEIDAKKYYPHLALGSGFNLNVVNKETGALGISQLRPIAVADLNFSQAYQKGIDFLNENASKKSCSRIVQQIDQLQKVEVLESFQWASDQEKCKLINLPPNPLLSFFYLAIQQKRTEEQFEKFWAVTSSQLLEKSGVSLTGLQIDTLKSQIKILANDLGAGAAVALFNSYIKSKISSSAQLKFSDFDLLIEARMFGPKGKMRVNPSLKDGDLTFFEYLLRQNQFYLRDYVAQVKNLNTIFPEGTCAPLALSLE